MGALLGGSGGIIEGNKIVVGSSYRSAESSQIETFASLNLSNSTAYQTILTVPTGKTFYCTSIIFTRGNETGTLCRYSIAVGDVDKLTVFMDQIETTHLSFNIPIFFTSGTVVQGKQYDGTSATNTTITLIGFEE